MTFNHKDEDVGSPAPLPGFLPWSEIAKEFLLGNLHVILCLGFVIMALWPFQSVLQDPIGHLVRAIHTRPQLTGTTARYIRGFVDDDVEVTCSVHNDGATGDVRVFAVLKCGEQTWVKRQSLRLTAGADAEIKFLFEEFRRGAALYGITFEEGLTRDSRILKAVP